MKQTRTGRAGLAALSLLTMLLAESTAALSKSWRPPATAVAATLAQAAPSVKMVRARPTSTLGSKQSQGIAAMPATSRLEQPAAALPLVAPGLPQLVMVRGTVVRPTGQPCAGASVYAARAPRQLVVTDAQGAFTLPVAAGTAVLLRVEYFGEGSSLVEVPLPIADSLRITLGE